MRFLVWVCRILLLVVIAAFVATVFYLTHSVTFSDGAKITINLITIVGTALLGLAWPLMRGYWSALLLLVGLGVLRALFGTDPGLSSLEIPLLTQFQSDFIWISIGVVFVSLVGSIAARAIISDRRMRSIAAAASTVTTAQAVEVATASALQEAATPSEFEAEASAEAAEGEAPETPEAAETVAPPSEAEEPEVAVPEAEPPVDEAPEAESGESGEAAEQK